MSSNPNMATKSDLDRLRSALDTVGQNVSKTRAVAERTDANIDALKASFKNLYEQLHEQFKIMIRQLTNLEQLPGLFKNTQEVIQTQFQMSFLRQFEALVVGHMTRILANENRIKALETFLLEKHTSFEREYERVDGRYRKILQQLGDHNSERRQKLDSHAYELLEKYYQRQVLHPLRRQSMKAYDEFSAHAIESARGRSASLGEEHRRLADAVEDFLTIRDAAMEEISAWIDLATQPGHYQLNCWVAEVKNRETGSRRFELRFPSGYENLPKDLRERLAQYVRAAANAGRNRLLDSDHKEILAAHLEQEHGVPDAEAARFRASDVKVFDSDTAMGR